MSLIKPSDPKAQKLVDFLVGVVSRIKFTRETFRILFEDDNAKKIMEKAGNAFFKDINGILIDYLLLEFTKIADRAKSGKNRNTTLEYIAQSIDWPAKTRKELECLTQKAHAFQKKIKKARDKLLAHYDVSAILKNKKFGDFPLGEDLDFIETLESFCNIAHRETHGRIAGDFATGYAGDAVDLLKMLRMGLAFDQLFKKSRGEEKLNLHDLLNSIDNTR